MRSLLIHFFFSFFVVVADEATRPVTVKHLVHQAGEYQRTSLSSSSFTVSFFFCRLVVDKRDERNEKLVTDDW